MTSNDFSQYLIDIINAGSLSLMLSIGHRTRIFDVMAELPPSTVQEIASKSNLNERYVKEWLGAIYSYRRKHPFRKRIDNSYNVIFPFLTQPNSEMK